MYKEIINDIDDEIRIAKDGSYIEVPWYEAHIFEDIISEKIKKLINLILEEKEDEKRN